MKSTKSIISCLNKILTNELTAINQYFLHSRMLENWGFETLAQKTYEESIDEMKHADILTKRILFLEGLPNLQQLDKLLIGETLEDILQCDLKLEERAIPDLKEAIILCEKENDFVSRQILVDILKSEEEHYDWLETQIQLIEEVGIENYKQSVI